MSTPPPPDRPTEPLRRPRTAPVVEEPLRPAPVVEQPLRPAPVVRERVVAPVIDPDVMLLRLEDTIDALRTWLVIVGLVAVAALGVAIYAVLDDDTSTRAGGSPSGLASDERVSQLDTRIDRLSRQVQDLRVDGASGGDAAALANRVDDLESTVKSLSGQPAATGTQGAVDELSGRIDDLAADVEQLKSAQP